MQINEFNHAQHTIIPLSTFKFFVGRKTFCLADKLSQLANGCVYDDDGRALAFHDRKLDALENILEAAPPLSIP